MRKIQILLVCLLCCHFTFAQNCPPSKNSNTHIVQKGETLYRIAKQYGLSVAKLTQLNGMTANDVLPLCKELVVAKGEELQSKGGDFVKNDFGKSFGQYVKQEGKYHYVQPGETIANIARLYGYTTARFKEFNKLATYQSMNVGQALLNSDCDCSTATIPADKITDGAENRFENKGGTTTKDTNTNSTSTNASNSLKLNPSQYPYMKGEELEMLEEINLVRSDPKGYIPYIKAYIKEVKQSRMGFGDPVASAYELIEQLEETAPLSILQPLECVYTAAKKHGQDRLQAGSNDHVGTDGSWPWDRILKECPNLRDGNENLVGGPAKVRKAVILLLVDDGIANRGHRSTLLNPNWRYGATYKIGKIGMMPNSWVQNFAY